MLAAWPAAAGTVSIGVNDGEAKIATASTIQPDGLVATEALSEQRQPPVPLDGESRLPLHRFGRNTGAAERRRHGAIQQRDATFRRALALADASAAAAALWVGVILLGDDRLTPASIGGIALLILLMKVIGLYDRDQSLIHKTTLDELPALFEVSALCSLLLWLADGWIVEGSLGRRQVFGMWLLLFGLLIVARALARWIAGRITSTERCLLLGDARAAATFSAKLALIGSRQAELVGWLPLGKALGTDPVPVNGDGAPESIRLPGDLEGKFAELQIHRVVVAPGRVDSDALLHLVRRLNAMSVHVSILPATPPVAGRSVEFDDIHGLALLGARGFGIGRSSRLLKRAFDIVASSIAIVVFAPVLLLIAVAVRLDSPGPPLFRQRRIGRNGEAFEMLKFRSMFEGSEYHREELRELNDADGLFKIERDPRVTRVGRILRRWSLDELPQLINVLRGEMSLVGPRPLVPEEDSMVVGHFRRRLDVAPGITGDWQALGASRIPLREMVRLDYLYVSSWSLWSDARILLRTIPFVLAGRGR
jgi:exopolysaccharide biosynthesis polyprenyl glycosylphosphotransferase